MRRTSLLRLAVVPVVSLVVLTGCGSSEEGSSSGGSSDSSSSSGSSEESGDSGSEQAAEPLTKADFGDRIYAAFKDAGTLKFTLDQSGSGASIKGTGEADLSGDQPASKVMTGANGTDEAIVVDGFFYLKSAQIGTGDKYLKVDPKAKDGLGAFVGALGGNSDPSKILQVMNQASEVTAEGQEEVDGEPTTKYHVVLPRAAFAKALGSDARVTQLLPEQIEFDMWVDGEDRVRKQVQQLEVAGQKSTTTVTYSDFGKPVDIEAPPASQTTTKAPGLGG